MPALTKWSGCCIPNFNGMEVKKKGSYEFKKNMENYTTGG